MGKRSLFPLLLVLMAFSHLIISTAEASFSRTQRLFQQSKSMEDLGSSPQKIAQMSNHEVYKAERDELISWRMDIEVNDYPGSGANNHHTPPHPP